jgi:hypothetical protein
VALLREPSADGGPDESGCAGDENLHAWISVICW